MHQKPNWRRYLQLVLWCGVVCFAACGPNHGDDTDGSDGLARDAAAEAPARIDAADDAGTRGSDDAGGTDIGGIDAAGADSGDRCLSIQCMPDDDCHRASCDSMTGRCVSTPLDDRTSCNDGNACTTDDHCQAGMCVAGDPVTCVPQGPCRQAGICDPANGECSDPAKPDGVACNDGDGCTQTDSCQGGVCIGANPVKCADPDICHVSGTCQPATGTCLFPTVADCSDLPADPSKTASPIDPSVATVFADATRFLYEGATPIQIGMSAATIERRRAAVLRGTVRTRDGNPLPGVKVTILGHPEYGSTKTRTDGVYDMVVNGGGFASVVLERNGFMPVQRQVDLIEQTFNHTHDVVMTARDAKVTRIESGAANAQIAQGSVVEDADGKRRVTLGFPPGVSMAILGKEGSTRPVEAINVRATEYTVGADGPAAMPADLPKTNGYTYCVELSADEAVNGGVKLNGTDVTFTKPVLLYVTNFLGLPVGAATPTGYFDNTTGQWVGVPSGEVIKIVSITGGRAGLDTNGDKAADSSAELASAGIADWELETLGANFAVGDELWRQPIMHFSTYDMNEPIRYPPAGATGPDAEVQTDPVPPCPTQSHHSIVECESQALGETIPIPGTPYSLVYTSRDAPGRSAGREVTIDLGTKVAPAAGQPLYHEQLARVVIETYVAGHFSTFRFTPVNQSSLQFESGETGVGRLENGRVFHFTWNGRDAYGRAIYGRVPALFRIGYEYPGVYGLAGSFGGSGASGSGAGTSITSSGRRATFTFWKERYLFAFENWDGRARGLGGWRLSDQHLFDLQGRVLELGTGARLTEDTAGQGAAMIANGLACGFIVEAKEAPNGDVYLLYNCGNPSVGGSLWRVPAAGGAAVLVAGLGTEVKDKVPATQTRLTGPISFDFAPDGTIYLADNADARLLRIDAAGMATAVMGSGKTGWTGPCAGDPKEVNFGPWYHSVSVAPDGAVYVSGSYCGIQRLGTDGRVTNPYSDLTGPMVVAPNGTVYFSPRFGGYNNTDPSRVLALRPSGEVVTAVGRGSSGNTIPSLYDGDFGPPLQAGIDVRQLLVTREGTLIIVQGACSRGCVSLREVGDGIIRTILTLPPSTSDPVALSKTAGIIYADGGGLSRALSGLPGLSTVNGFVAAEDGRSVYEFSPAGRHVGTNDALTGTQLLSLAYDVVGRLASITDGYQSQTSIERSAAGNPTALVSPDGLRTELAVDVDGWLTSVRLPGGETYEMTYAAGGLLASFMNPRGATSTFAYQSGRLVSDTDAVGSSLSLSVQSLATDSTRRSGNRTTLTSGAGRTSMLDVEALQDDSVRRTSTGPDATKTVTTTTTSNETTSQEATGVSSYVRLAPDPRWGMAAAYPAEIRLMLPSGLKLTETVTQSVTLADLTKPLSLTSWTASRTMNNSSWTSQYDASSRTLVETSPTKRTVTTVVNAAGQVVSRRVGDLAPVTTAYDSRGRPIEIKRVAGNEQRALQLGYDNSGFLQTITDSLQNTTTLTRGKSGYVTSYSSRGVSGVVLARDEGGTIVGVTPPGGGQHAFAYTPADLLASYAPPAVSGVNTPPASFAYDLDREPTGLARPDSRTLGVAYDGAGRPRVVSLAAGDGLPAETIAYSYDATTGSLMGIAHSDGVTSEFAYDGVLLTTEKTSGLRSSPVILARDYDPNLRIVAERVDGANEATFGYDADGLLVRAGSITLSRDGKSGLLIATTLGSVSDAWTYNAFGESTGYVVRAGATELFRTALTRDGGGRITANTETVQGDTTTWGYTYNLAGQLTDVTRNGAAWSRYSYDANGNRTAANVAAPAPTSVSATYDAQDRLLTIGAATYSYTSNGELKVKTENGSATTYSYDAAGYLRAVSLPDGHRIEYLMDGRDRRVGKKVDGTLVQAFVYSGQLAPVAELDGAGNLVARFIYATRVNVPDYLIKNGVTYRVVTDQTGSPRLIVNAATGEVVQRVDRDAFGTIVSDTNSGFTPFGFAGGLDDRATGLVSLGARNYDPGAGRWTVRDPLLFATGASNLFAYADSDPINNVDPTGFDSYDVGYSTGTDTMSNSPTNELGEVLVRKGSDIAKDSIRSWFADKIASRMFDRLQKQFPTIDVRKVEKQLSKRCRLYRNSKTWLSDQLRDQFDARYREALSRYVPSYASSPSPTDDNLLIREARARHDPNRLLRKADEYDR